MVMIKSLLIFKIRRLFYADEAEKKQQKKTVIWRRLTLENSFFPAMVLHMFIYFYVLKYHV